MASEQKLQVTDENQSSAPSATSEDTTYPPQEQPSSCASDYGLQGEPMTHPVTASPEDRREEVEGTGASGGYGGITGGEQVGGDGAGKEEKTTEYRPHPVTDVEVLGDKEEVPVGILVSVDESSPLGEGADQGTQVTGEVTGPQGTGDKKEPQETCRETEPQVTGEVTDSQGTGDKKEPQETRRETEPQVTGEETDPQGTGDEKEEPVKSEGTDPQNKDEASAPQVTEISEPQGSDEKRDAQGTDTGVHQNPEAQMSSAGEKWIDMLVHTIVTEVTGDGVCTGEPDTGVEAADTRTVMKEHSSTQEAGTETVTGGQVTLQGAGAAGQVHAGGPVSTDNTDIALQVRVEEAGAEQVTVDTAGIEKQVEETASHREDSAGAQVTATAGIDRQVEETASHREDSAGAQVTVDTAGIDKQVEETASHREDSAGAQVTATAGIDKQVEETASHREDSAGAQVTVDTAGIDKQVEETASHREDSAGAQVTVETAGIDKQVEETASHSEDSAGAQVTATAEEVQEEIRSNLAVGGQVIASGAETDREVTPDLDALPGREGIADQDQPVACREKEWPSLICTASEVRTVTVEEGDSQQGSVTPKEPSDETPEMKEREIIEDGYTATPETPIEREIRLTMEREMTLRQERGISSPVGNPEFVEVRRRTISVEPAGVFGKERQLAGAQMQREIQLETQREQDLVELGKVMGTYDRGPQQELQEKKMIFESMNTEPSDVPIKKKQNEPQQQPKPQEAPPSNIPAPTNHVVPARETKKGPSYTEANGSNVIIIEHSNMLRRSVSGNPFSPAPADSRRSTPADYYRSAPADSRRSTPAELSRTNWSGSPLPNSADSPVPPGSPYQLLRSPSPRSLLEQEIEEVKERERELQRQRSSIYGTDDSTGETTQKKQEITSDVQSVYQPERPNWGKLEVNWPPNKEAALNGQQQVSDSPRYQPQRITLIKRWESRKSNPQDDE